MTWTHDDMRAMVATFLEHSRPELARLARAHYSREGRGVIAISMRGDRPAVPAFRELQIGYRSAADYRRRTAGVTHPGITYTMRLIDTYDPATEAVLVMAAGPTFLTVAGIMKLEMPLIAEESNAVH